MSNRRKAKRLARLMGAVMAGQVPAADVRIWEQETCRCGHAVMFVAGQTANRCGWCGWLVIHAVG